MNQGTRNYGSKILNTDKKSRYAQIYTVCLLTQSFSSPSFFQKRVHGTAPRMNAADATVELNSKK
jgi:hypothetical protein